MLYKGSVCGARPPGRSRLVLCVPHVTGDRAGLTQNPTLPCPNTFHLPHFSSKGMPAPNKCREPKVLITCCSHHCFQTSEETWVLLTHKSHPSHRLSEHPVDPAHFPAVETLCQFISSEMSAFSSISFYLLSSVQKLVNHFKDYKYPLPNQHCRPEQNSTPVSLTWNRPALSCEQLQCVCEISMYSSNGWRGKARQ